MAETVERLPSLSPPQSLELQAALNEILGIDEGDAYLLTHLVEDRGSLLLSGDGRMLRALYEAEETLGVRQAIQGRVLLFPQIIGGLVRTLSLAEVEHRWRSVAPSATKDKQKSLAVMFGSSSPTLEAEFWRGYEFQLSSLTDLCGLSWLYPL